MHGGRSPGLAGPKAYMGCELELSSILIWSLKTEQHSGQQSELMARSWSMEKMSEICIPPPLRPGIHLNFLWWDNTLSFFPCVMFRWDFVPCDRKSQLIEQETILSPVLWSPGNVLPALTSFKRMWIELERNHGMCPFDSNSGSCLGRQSFHQDHPSTHPYFRLPVSTGLSLDAKDFFER